MFDEKIQHAHKYIENLDAKELGTKIAIAIGAAWVISDVLAFPFAESWIGSGIPGAMLIYRLMKSSFVIAILASGWAGWIWYNRPKDSPADPAPAPHDAEETRGGAD